MPTTIVLADDHHAVRAGLRLVLEAQEGFCVIGEATGGIEALRLAEDLRPDVIIVDLMMRDLNGLEVVRQVGRRSPQSRLIILSGYAEEVQVIEALRHGAAGYVLKGASTSDLVYAVREVAAGRRYLSPLLSQRAIEVYLHHAPEAASDPLQTLTARERDVLHLLVLGGTNRDLASHLGISVRTVETHRANLMRKLGLRTHSELIRYAVQRGMLPREP
jgi:two-component system, NarL family, response regulator NreC